MAASEYVRDDTIRNRLNDVRMSTYERQAAQQQLDEAMWLADLAIRATNRITGLLRAAGSAVRALFAHKRDYVRNGVVQSD